MSRLAPRGRMIGRPIRGDAGGWPHGGDSRIAGLVSRLSPDRTGGTSRTSIISREASSSPIGGRGVSTSAAIISSLISD